MKYIQSFYFEAKDDEEASCIGEAMINAMMELQKSGYYQLPDLVIPDDIKVSFQRRD